MERSARIYLQPFVGDARSGQSADGRSLENMVMLKPSHFRLCDEVPNLAVAARQCNIGGVAATSTAFS
jgi:hypothetical protein